MLQTLALGFASCNSMLEPSSPCKSVTSRSCFPFEKSFQRSSRLPDLPNNKSNSSDFPSSTLKNEAEPSSLATIKPWNYGPKLSRNRSVRSPYSNDAHPRCASHTNSTAMGSDEKNARDLINLNGAVSISFSEATNTAPVTSTGTTTTTTTKPTMAGATSITTKNSNSTAETRTTHRLPKSHRIIVGFQANSKWQKDKMSPTKFMNTAGDLNLKPARNLRIQRLYPMKFLHSDSERRLFEKQRTVIYALNAIMRDSEKAKYEAFVKSQNSGDKTSFEG